MRTVEARLPASFEPTCSRATPRHSLLNSAASADSGGTVKDARDLGLRWRERVSTAFRETRDSADDRALLLAAVLLEGLSPAEILAGARLLLDDRKTRGIRDILTGRDLVTRLEAVQANIDGQRVSFGHLPVYPAAVLRHFGASSVTSSPA
ncbi:hypothetical protein [Streptomyces sp. CA-179760]|uniref:hypothetical protein n=1 Tax=Streptomyces sp. CA-179760 TaxID=3240054 RepID=UPI003D923271